MKEKAADILDDHEQRKRLVALQNDSVAVVVCASRLAEEDSIKLVPSDFVHPVFLKGGVDPKAAANVRETRRTSSNMFNATIVDVATNGTRAFVTVLVADGVQLKASTTMRSVEVLGVQKGARVTIAVDAADLRLIES